MPAFVGLGAPYWDAECRGAMYGLTRGTGPAEFARAPLEAVCFQTRDLLEAMRGDWGAARETVLRVDGGMVASDWTMQRLADILAAPVDRPKVLETTALGRRLSRGPEGRALSGPGRVRQGLGARAPVLAEARRRDARSQICWVEGRRRAHAHAALTGKREGHDEFDTKLRILRRHRHRRGHDPIGGRGGGQDHQLGRGRPRPRRANQGRHAARRARLRPVRGLPRSLALFRR